MGANSKLAAASGGEISPRFSASSQELKIIMECHGAVGALSSPCLAAPVRRSHLG